MDLKRDLEKWVFTMMKKGTGFIESALIAKARDIFSQLTLYE